MEVGSSTITALLEDQYQPPRPSACYFYHRLERGSAVVIGIWLGGDKAAALALHIFCTCSSTQDVSERETPSLRVTCRTPPRRRWHTRRHPFRLRGSLMNFDLGGDADDKPTRPLRVPSVFVLSRLLSPDSMSRMMSVFVPKAFALRCASPAALVAISARSRTRDSF